MPKEKVVGSEKIEEGHLSDKIGLMPEDSRWLNNCFDSVETAEQDSQTNSVIANKVREFIEDKISREEIEPTISSSAKMHLYNAVVVKKGDRQEVERAVLDIYKLSRIEKKFRGQPSSLPTEGVEIEMPVVNMNVKLLSDLGIENVSAEDRSRSLWEVNPNFSYSPNVQARILQELAVMEQMPLDASTKSKLGQVSKDILSLHINFGLPETSYKREELQAKFKSDLLIFSDILNYAFSSPERLLKRKSTIAFDIKTDARKVENKSSVIRLELKAPEFRDYPSFRMLSESQALAACLFSSIKESDDQKLLKQEKRLSKLWDEFRNKAQDLFDENRVYSLGLLDTNAVAAAGLARDKEFKLGCRRLISRYAKLVLEEVFPEDFEDTKPK